jgi:hypothetical protein
MHWTALLAHRRFPPSARVIDDLACIACGYNLRGIRVGDRCPECGGNVGDSLFLLAKPDIVGRGFNGIGKSFLAVFGIVIVIISSATWAPMLAAGVIAAGAIWRTFHAAELRYRGAIVRLPMIGPRIEVLWCCMVVDAVVSLALLAIAIIFALDPSAFSPQVLRLAFVCWFMTLMLCMATAGWMGRPFATMLGYGWMSIEFTVQRTWVAATAAFAMIVMLLRIFSAPQTPLLIGMAVFALVFGGAILFTAITLLQLANAAYRSSETLDDAIDMFAGDAKPSENKPAPVISRPQRPGIPLARD